MVLLEPEGAEWIVAADGPSKLGLARELRHPPRGRPHQPLCGCLPAPPGDQHQPSLSRGLWPASRHPLPICRWQLAPAALAFTPLTPTPGAAPPAAAQTANPWQLWPDPRGVTVDLRQAQVGKGQG